MRPPSKKEAIGYDIVVWRDKDDDIVCRAFTKLGDRTLRAFVNEYEKGAIVMIHCDPDQFMEEVPKTVSIGLLSEQTKKVVPMTKSPLH